MALGSHEFGAPNDMLTGACFAFFLCEINKARDYCWTYVLSDGLLQKKQYISGGSMPWEKWFMERKYQKLEAENTCGHSKGGNIHFKIE